MSAGVAIGALAGGALLEALRPLTKYNMTGTGIANRYTFRAAVNVLVNHRYWEKARSLIDATITSAYRSPLVNSKVGGVTNSDHVQGRAVDLVPSGDAQKALKALRAACERGDIGHVRQFIWESYKHVIHLGYYEPGKTGPTQYLEQYAVGKHKDLVTVA